jgi:hypothetical protein
VNLSPIAFHKWSNEYLAAAKAITPAKSFSPVPYYLHGLAAELALKAFLLAAKVSRKTLSNRTLGHDLLALLEMAEEKGLRQRLPITSEAREQITLLKGYYTPRDLEYFPLEKALRGFKGLPDLAQLTTFLEGLLRAIEADCRTAE